MRWLELKVPPPLVLFLVAVCMWVAERWGGVGLAVNWVFYAGVLVMAAGFALAFRGPRTLVANRTTPSPIQIERAKKLVTTGLYQFSRNPMYLGMVIFLIGVAALFGDWRLLVGPLFFAVYISVFQIAPEERMMRQKFGADYAAYVARVRRWI